MKKLVSFKHCFVILFSAGGGSFLVGYYQGHGSVELLTNYPSS